MKMVDPVQHKASQMQWALESCINSRKHAFILKSSTNEAAMLCAKSREFGYFNLDEPFNSVYPGVKK